MRIYIEIENDYGKIYSPRLSEEQVRKIFQILNGTDSRPQQHTESSANATALLETRIRELRQSLLQVIQEGLSTTQNRITDLGRNVVALQTNMESLRQNITPLGDTLANMDYNLRSGMLNQGAGQDGQAVEAMQTELQRYKEDVYMKLMRQYIIDSHLSIYQKIAHRLYEKPGDEELPKVLKLIRMTLSSLGIEAQTSPVGSEFRPADMEVSFYPSRPTEDRENSGRVAASIVPQFIWTLPAVGMQNQRMTLLKEEVVLYEYDNNNLIN